MDIIFLISSIFHYIGPDARDSLQLVMETKKVVLHLGPWGVLIHIAFTKETMYHIETRCIGAILCFLIEVHVHCCKKFEAAGSHLTQNRLSGRRKSASFSYFLERTPCALEEEATKRKSCSNSMQRSVMRSCTASLHHTALPQVMVMAPCTYR